MADERRCTGTTKKGNPCRAHPMEGRDTCLAHSDEETRGSARFGGPQPGSGRPRNPRPTEVLREIVEAQVLAFIEPELRILGLQVAYDEAGTPRVEKVEGAGAKLYASSKAGVIRVSQHDDLAAMAAAANRIFDRVYGRPRQAVEHSGPDGGPIRTEQGVDLSRLSLDERRQVLALLEKAGQA